MAGDSSFDIVSKIDHQEVDNAINQAAREISQRFDFKNTGASSPGTAPTRLRCRPTQRSARWPWSTCSRRS